MYYRVDVKICTILLGSVYMYLNSLFCPVDIITHLVVLPLPDGCILYACYNGEL